MTRKLVLTSVVLVLAMVGSPALAAGADTYHGTLHASQHYCDDVAEGPAYAVTGVWNLNAHASRITFNYRNPTTGAHAVWSNLGAWTLEDPEPHGFTNSYGGGFITFEATFDPEDGSFTYVIELPDCGLTGWDRLVVQGTADRGRQER